VRKSSRDGNIAISSKAASRIPRKTWDCKRRLCKEENGISTLDVEETSLTESSIVVSCCLDLVVSDRNLRVDITLDGVDYLSTDGFTNLNLGDIDLVFNNHGSESKGRVGASVRSRRDFTKERVGLWNDRDVIRSMSKLARRNFKNEITSFAGGLIETIQGTGGRRAINKVDKCTESRSRDTREFDNKTRGNLVVIFSDLKSKHGGFPSRNLNLNGLIESEFLNLGVNEWSDLVRNIRSDNDVIVLRKVAASKISVIEQSGAVFHLEKVEIKVTGVDESGADINIDILRGSLKLNEEGDVRDVLSILSVAKVKVITACELTISG